MFNSSPRPRRPFSKPGARRAPRGAFENNQWLCDCSPRLPAEHFQVKKEGKNKGRWFYTCQKHETERCGFFLWQEDAGPRMQGAVLGNSHDELTMRSKRAADAQAMEIPVASKRGKKRGKKRTLPWDTKENQKSDVTKDGTATAEEEFFDVSENEEQALSRVTDKSGTKPAPWETPRKAQRTTYCETPANSATNGANLRHGIPTPGTTPLSGRKTSDGQRADPDTPTPSRTRDALASEPSLSEKAMQLLLLFDVSLKSSAANALRGLLDSEARKWQGVVKGRDAARAIIQTREIRIAELLERLRRVEGENEAHKALLAHQREKK